MVYLHLIVISFLAQLNIIGFCLIAKLCPLEDGNNNVQRPFHGRGGDHAMFSIKTTVL